MMLLLFSVSLLTWGVVESIKLHSERKEKLKVLRAYVKGDE